MYIGEDRANNTMHASGHVGVFSEWTVNRALRVIVSVSRASFRWLRRSGGIEPSCRRRLAG